MKISLSIVLLCLFGAAAFASDNNISLFWKSWEKADYRGAKKYGEAAAVRKQEYLVPLYYIDQIDTENGYREVVQQLLDQNKNSIANADNLLDDCRSSIGNGSWLYYFMQAIVQNIRKEPWEDTLDKSLKIKKSADAILYRFFNGRDHSTDDIKDAENLLPGNTALVFINLRANLIVKKDISVSQGDIDFLLISNKSPLPIDDYRYLGQVFLGVKSLSAIGPGGPNGEPFYGELYHVTNWSLIDKMSPEQKLFFACTAGYGGFQGTTDAEKIIKDIPAELLNRYRDEVYLLRLFENFYSYNYDKVLALASEIVSNQGLSSRMMYSDYYNMAYQLEMQGMRFKIMKLSEASALLYQKAYENIPEWAGYSKNYIAYEWARALYFTGRYQDAISLLEKNLSLDVFPYGTIILSWAYYRLNDNVNGKKYEDIFNKEFNGQQKLQAQFYSELSNINSR
jgi:hypothetical protein